MKNVKNILLSAVVAFGLTACGGGGGGSASSVKDDTMSFPSNAVKAEPTVANAKKVKEAVIGDKSNLFTGINLNSVSENTSKNIILVNKTIEDTILSKVKTLNTDSLNEVINEKTECGVSGSIKYTGNGSEEQGGKVTITFDNCKNNTEYTIDGKMTMKYAHKDSSADDFKNKSVKFDSTYSIKDSSGQVVMSIAKGSYMDIEVSSFKSDGEMEKYKVSTSMIVSNSAGKYGIKDCEFFYDLSQYNTLMQYQTKGSIYIGSDLSMYVTYDTSYDMSATPFKYQGSALVSGEAQYNMKDGAKVKVKVEAGQEKCYVDADGDGTFELSE